MSLSPDVNYYPQAEEPVVPPPNAGAHVAQYTFTITCRECNGPVVHLNCAEWGVVRRQAFVQCIKKGCRKTFTVSLEMTLFTGRV